ncbi:MAG: 3-deoxy-8-phosphooctulonate synthase [Rhodobacteraceae bacterium]|nr:3-deoxy-8-phosphooctulonate synthase [Paracoccaceae bacterium]
MQKPEAAIDQPAGCVQVLDVRISNDGPLTLISGPCQIESLDHSLEIAGRLQEITAATGLSLVFKSSFDKANRSSIGGIRGIGFEHGLRVLQEVRKQFNCPVLTDVHDPGQCGEAAEAVDILQIPAFLSRQTDLLLAAGRTKAAINVKKGQFLAPWDMEHVAAKIQSTGNHRILLCERGASFGYNMLVTDMRSIPILAALGHPVVIDATHSVQQPGGRGTSSGGQRHFAPVIARAAAAVGVAAVFIETHDNPDSAPSDGPTMIALDDMPALLKTLTELDGIAKSSPLNMPISDSAA